MTQAQCINIKFLSFGYSYGVPKNVDLLFSARHLPMTNVDNYQQYDGRHKRIQNELLDLPEYEEMLKTIMEKLQNFIHEQGKHSITVAVGCEQGRHRSVAIIERLATMLGTNDHIEVNHRDLQRTGCDKKKQQERAKNRDRKYNNYDDND